VAAESHITPRNNYVRLNYFWKEVKILNGIQSQFKINKTSVLNG